MDAPAKPRVTIVGSANVDFIMRLPALPGRGETVTGGEFAQVFGGKGANSAVAAARAASPGMTVGFVARLGTDAFAEAMRRDFAAAGLDVTHVGTDPDVPSGTALVMVGGDGENYLSVAPGSNARLTPGHVDAAADVIAASSVLLTQMEVPAETVRRALDVARSAGVRTVVNYAPAAKTPLALDESIDTLVVNTTEAAQLAGGAGEPDALAAALLERGPASVLLTLGAEGVVVADGRGVRRQSAFEVEPVDTTAAGDTFCGAYAVAIAEGRGIDAAVRFAQAAAAMCVEVFGAQPSIPDRSAIERKAGKT